MIVRRRSLRAAEYDTVVAKLRRTASTGLSSPRLLSNDALGRELIVRERVSRSLSDSEPDKDEMFAAGSRESPSSANADCMDTFRLLAPLSCCCCSPVSADETFEDRENVTPPFVCEELLDALLEIGKGFIVVDSGEIDTVVWLRAVVGLEGLMAGVNGVGSGRMVRFELAEILRLDIVSEVEGPIGVIRDSDGRVDRAGATDGNGRRSDPSKILDCREIGVGDGS